MRISDWSSDVCSSDLFDTPDGTGVRDFIHVSDLAEAHVLALEHLERGGQSVTLNCGYGHGASVLPVVETVEAITGRRLPVRNQPRRMGDPPYVSTAASQLRRILNWHPEHDTPRPEEPWSGK